MLGSPTRLPAMTSLHNTLSHLTLTDVRNHVIFIESDTKNIKDRLRWSIQKIAVRASNWSATSREGSRRHFLRPLTRIFAFSAQPKKVRRDVSRRFGTSSGRGSSGLRAADGRWAYCAQRAGESRRLRSHRLLARP